MSIMFRLVNLLPRLIAAYERLCIRIASEGFHKPGFYFSTVFTAPIGLSLWRRPIAAWWRRIPVRLIAYGLLLASLSIFLHGAWIFALLLLPGRLIRRIWRWAGFDESRPFPEVPASFAFSLTRMDRAMLAFMGLILLVFFVNRSQLMPTDDSDHNYHMAVARQILEHKGIPEWDSWEYAPAGRPHLYPPALHVLIALFAGHPDKIIEGFETLQVVVYPLALLLAWWFARWLFGARLGFLTALVFSMDMISGYTMISVLPSALVTAFMPLLFMCFLTRRSRSTIALLTLALYTHIGMSALIFLGLFFFAARHRGYYAFFKKVLTFSFIFYLPWFFRLLDSIHWLGTPSTFIFDQTGRSLASLIQATVMGLLSLQFVNPVFLVLGLIGLRNARHPAVGFMRAMLAGFVPMLISYGGRFWMHTGPLWAVFTAGLFARWVPENPTRRRVVALLLCTLIPLPLIAINSLNGGKGVKLIPNVGGATFSLAYILTPAKEDADYLRLADFIRRSTSPREIVHVDPDRIYLGDRIVVSTGRRVDVGGWSAEVRNQDMADKVAAYRAIDTDCLFVYEKAEIPADLRCDRVEVLGRFTVGIRGKQAPLPDQQHPPEPPRVESARK